MGLNRCAAIGVCAFGNRRAIAKKTREQRRKTNRQSSILHPQSKIDNRTSKTLASRSCQQSTNQIMKQQQRQGFGQANPCAWCDKEQGITRTGEVSHGICKVHSEKLMGEVKLSPIVKAMNRHARKLQKGNVKHSLPSESLSAPCVKFVAGMHCDSPQQDTFVPFQPMSRLQATVADGQRIASRIASTGHNAGMAARGKYGKVSKTSIDEASAVARTTVINLFSLDGYFDIARFDGVMGMMMEIRDSIRSDGQLDALSYVLRAAKRASIQSLLGDLTGGQTGDTVKLKSGVHRVIDSFMRATTEGWDSGYYDSFDGAEPMDKALPVQSVFDRLTPEDVTNRSDKIESAERARALGLVRMVRTASIKRIATMRYDKFSSVGYARLNRGLVKSMLRSARRVARVLSMVSQGDSLEYACLTVGFDWRNYSSPAFTAAFRKFVPVVK